MRTTIDRTTGERICAVCGDSVRGKTKCCKTASWVSFDNFIKIMFPDQLISGWMERGDPNYDHWLPTSTAQEFYNDYLTSDCSSLKAYADSR